MHPAVMAFMALWFAGVVFIGGALFITSLMPVASAPARAPAGLWLGVAIPVVMIVFGAGLLRFGRHFARGEQLFLINFVREATAAPRQSLPLGEPAEQKQDLEAHDGATSRRTALSFLGRRLQRSIAEQRGVAMLIFGALFVLWGFGYETVGLRLGIAVDGVVVTRQVIPRTWASHGTGVVYVVRDSNGVDQTYIAGATDGSLPRNIPLGAHIVKRKWELSYVLNGKRVSDFPIIFYSIVLGSAIVGLIWAIFRLVRPV